MSSGVNSCAALFCSAVCLLMVLQAWAESSGSWGPWSECSKSCDGVQHQEWQCGTGGSCDSRPTQTRKCNEHGCLTQEMLFAIIAIGGAVVLLLIVILIVCIRRRHNKEKMIRKQKRSRYGPETAENGHSKNSHQSNRRRQSFHQFPSQRSHFTEERGAEGARAEKTEALQSMPASSHHGNKTVFEAVNPTYDLPSVKDNREREESIQEAQAIFGPDDPNDLASVAESSSMTSTESGSSEDDGNVPSPPVIYSTVKK